MVLVMAYSSCLVDDEQSDDDAMRDAIEGDSDTDLRVEDDVDQQLGVTRMRRAVLDIPRRFHVYHHPCLGVRHLWGSDTECFQHAVNFESSMK